MAIFKENIYEQILDDLRALNSLKNEAEFITFLEKIRDHASKIYTQIQKSVVEVDYSILRTQIAYVLRYFPGYWYQIYKALCVLDEDNLIAFRKNSINIGLFGCGPCPEIIGITRFFEKIRHRELALNIPQTINLNLFDKHSDDWLYARNLFISPESRIEKLNQFVLINVDVTEMTNEQNDLLKKYQLYGPPAFVILDSNEFTIMKKSVGSIDKKSMLEFLSLDAL